MSEGIDRRAQIDAEVVNGLVIINGGAAAALLAFMPDLLKEQELYQFSTYVLWALLVLLFGLVFAVIHNHLRRRCSLAHDNREKKSFCGEPAVCCLSHIFMWASLVSFVVAGLLVFCGGQKLVSSQEKASIPIPVVSPAVQATVPASENILPPANTPSRADS